MIKRVVLAVAGVLALSPLLPAQSPGIPRFTRSLLEEPSLNSPWLSLESQDRFFFSTGFGSMRTTEKFLPPFDPSAPLSTAYISGDNKSPVDRLVDLRAPSKIQFGGEMGFLYGKSTGSHGFGREDFAGYIIGTVGNDQFSITAGYYRQETSFSGQRWRR